MTSGYTHCACRDCFETVVSDDMTKPDFCQACEDAGCEHDSECAADVFCTECGAMIDDADEDCTECFRPMAGG